MNILLPVNQSVTVLHFGTSAYQEQTHSTTKQKQKKHLQGPINQQQSHPSDHVSTDGYQLT